MSSNVTGLFVMAYGTADGPGDIERYYTDIRGGRPPSSEHLAELTERYAAIGNRFPLLDTTAKQAEEIAAELNLLAAAAGEETEFRPYLGLKHSAPFIADGVAKMQADGIQRAVGIVMAPHWSGMSIETYVNQVEKAVDQGDGPAFAFVRSFHDDPAFIEFLAGRVSEAIETLDEPDRDGAMVIFSAHSLPVRTTGDGTQLCKYCDSCEISCRYADGLAETADLVANRLGIAESNYMTAWQSAGRTADPWWGPPIEEVIPNLASKGFPAAVVCSAGFVADHLETLYDLDIQAAATARRAGMAFARTRMPNDDPRFLAAVAGVVHSQLQKEPIS